MITTPYTPFEHHVDVDEENERRRQPRAFIILMNQTEPLEVPMNICVLLDHLECVTDEVNAV